MEHIVTDIIQCIISTAALAFTIIFWVAQRRIDKKELQSNNEAYAREKSKMQRNHEEQMKELHDNNRLSVLPLFSVRVFDQKYDSNTEHISFDIEIKNIGLNSCVITCYKVNDFCVCSEGINKSQEGDISVENRIKKSLCTVGECQTAMITVPSSKVSENVFKVQTADGAVTIQLYFKDIIGNNYIQDIIVRYHILEKKIFSMDVTCSLPVLLKH